MDDPIGLVLRGRQVLVTRLRPKTGVTLLSVDRGTSFGPCPVTWVTRRSRMLRSLTGLLSTTVLAWASTMMLLRSMTIGSSNVMMHVP